MTIFALTEFNNCFIMGLIRAAATLAIDNRFSTLSMELKWLGTSFVGAKHGRHVIRPIR